MLGPTHMATGIAASLVILRPTTVTGVICAVSGGVIGGLISDIDCKNFKPNGGTIPNIILTILSIIGTLCLDYIFGNKIYQSVITNWGVKSIIGVILILVCCIIGFFSYHRTFTHSFLGLSLFSVGVYLVCPLLSSAFIVGFSTHIILDLSNKKPIQIFYPLKKEICLKWFYSDKKANYIIRFIATMVSSILAAWFFIVAFSQENFSLKYHSQGILPLFTTFQWYLIIINIITFILCYIDYNLCLKTDIIKDQDFAHAILNIFTMAGGVIGMLLFFIIVGNRIGKENANWYATVLSFLIFWCTIYCVVCDPFHIGLAESTQEIMYHLPLFLYILIINLITFMVFFIDKDHSQSHWTKLEFGMFLLGVAGGAFGGLVTIILTGTKRNYYHFSYGFPVLLAAHTTLVGYLYLYGIA